MRLGSVNKLSFTRSQMPPSHISALSSHSHQSFSLARFHAFLSLRSLTLRHHQAHSTVVKNVHFLCTVLVKSEKYADFKKKKTPTVSASRAKRAFRHEEDGIMISAAQCCHRGPSSQAKPTDGNCRRDFDEGFLNLSGCK